jgi:NitT/TauT family transport system substrate-binding protein
MEGTMKLKPFAGALALLALSSSFAAAAEKLTIMYTATAAFASAFVAKDQGFFDKHGVDVTLQLNPNTSLVATAVASGSAEAGITTPTVALQAVDNGIPLVAFASTNVFPDRSAAGLIASPTSGIAGPKDLAGKKIGVPGIGGLLDVTMREWVTENGGDPSKINVVEIGLPQTADVLKSGQVDGVAGVDPFLSRAVDVGAGKIVGDFMSIVPPGTAGGIFVTTRAWADAHKDAVRGMQAALDEAVVNANANQESARASLAKYTTLPPKVVANIKWPNLSTHLSADKSLKFWNDLAGRQKLIGAPVDLKAFVIPYSGE